MQLEGIVAFNKVNNSKITNCGGDVEAVLGKKQVSEAFKKVSWTP